MNHLWQIAGRASVSPMTDAEARLLFRYSLAVVVMALVFFFGFWLACRRAPLPEFDTLPRAMSGAAPSFSGNAASHFSEQASPRVCS